MRTIEARFVPKDEKIWKGIVVSDQVKESSAGGLATRLLNNVDQISRDNLILEAMRQTRNSYIRILVLALILIVCFRCGGTAESPPEYKFKAAYLFHFTQFVEWPSNVFTDAKSPLIIGILGENPFGNELENGLRDKTVDGRPIKTRIIQSPAEARTNCHVLFISASEKQKEREIIQSLEGASILTVGETEDFTDSGGMIKFVSVDKRIRFEIKDETAKKAGLKIRAKLLTLAVPPSH